MLLLDAGVWVASKDAEDPYSAAARQLVLDPEQGVAALDLTLYEVANVVGVRRKFREAAGELCRTIAVRCGGRLIAVDAGLIDSALEISAEYGLTSYDAAYVATARSHDWTLVSTDIADLVSKGLAVAPDAAVYP
jgi:predicted nucleic acid-binding protein